jgi:small-conductance mechanosensitive channel
MTAFFKKYKWTILYWAILLFFLLYFAPRQSKYYLEQDIKQFKTLYLIPTLIWTFGLLAVGLFVFWLIKTKSAKQSTIWFLSTALTFAFIIFIFQNTFLGIALFANRQITKEKVIKTYQASFMAGTDISKNNFSPYDPSTKHISIDTKLINELYHTGLKQNDTIVLAMNKGIFGVAFSSHPFDDKY